MDEQSPYSAQLRVERDRQTMRKVANRGADYSFFGAFLYSGVGVACAILLDGWLSMPTALVAGTLLFLFLTTVLFKLFEGVSKHRVLTIALSQGFGASAAAFVVEYGLSIDVPTLYACGASVAGYYISMVVITPLMRMALGFKKSK